MTDITREFLSFPAADLSAFGVSALASTHVAKAKVRVDGRFFVPDENGGWMVIIPIMDGGEIVDMLAFDPADPDTWYRRMDGPVFLGGDSLVAASDPPIIHPHPLAWLQHDCDGVVVLNWTLARPQLRMFDKLVVLDPDYLTVVAARMMEPQPRVPEIICERTYA